MHLSAPKYLTNYICIPVAQEQNSVWSSGFKTGSFFLGYTIVDLESVRIMAILGLLSAYSILVDKHEWSSYLWFQQYMGPICWTAANLLISFTSMLIMIQMLMILPWSMHVIIGPIGSLSLFSLFIGTDQQEMERKPLTFS